MKPFLCLVSGQFEISLKPMETCVWFWCMMASSSKRFTHFPNWRLQSFHMPFWKAVRFSCKWLLIPYCMGILHMKIVSLWYHVLTICTPSSTLCAYQRERNYLTTGGSERFPFHFTRRKDAIIPGLLNDQKYLTEEVNPLLILHLCS